MRARGQRRRAGAIALVVLLPATFATSATLARSTSAASANGVAMPASASARAVRVEPPPRSVVLAATGDVITENAVNTAAAGWALATGERYRFEPIFAPVAPMLRAADVAICHMELPIGRPGERAGIYGKSPYGGNLLLAPYEVAAGLRAAGFDRCSTASNHSNDTGTAGIVSTLDALDAAGLGHSGTARSPEEFAITTFVASGVTIAHLSYTRYSNTVLPPSGWQLQFAATVDQVVRDVALARSLGAEVVVVSLHLSQELLYAPTAIDRSFVTELTRRTRVDLVVQHGPHVVQPVELVNGTWVYWSVGNLVSGMGWAQSGRYADPRTLDGLLALVRFTETAPGSFVADPATVLLCNERVSRTIYPVLPTLADPTITPGLRDQLQQCAARSLPVVPQAA